VSLEQPTIRIFSGKIMTDDQALKIASLLTTPQYEEVATKLKTGALMDTCRLIRHYLKCGLQEAIAVKDAVRQIEGLE
jgi:hypothetical protein